MLRLLPLLMLAGTPAAQDVHDVPEQVQALLRDYQGQVPGASVLVLRDGEPLLRAAWGMADLEAGVPATPRSCYRLASLTKQFTAAAILLLAQDGRLSLHDPARRWLPSLPPAAAAVTLHHLLSHTSGLVDYEDVLPAGLDRQVHDADVLAILGGQDRTYFPPGSAYRYSNSGYALLALVVERASGQDFPAFLRERIFAPLGMATAVAHREGHDTVAHRAWGYSQAGGAWVRTDQSPTSAVLGDGGIYASVDDLARWEAALHDDRLLRQPWRGLMFAPHTATDEPDVPHYGYGWRLNGDSTWHSGESIGFRNAIVRWPRQRLAVVVLSNRDEPGPYPLALALGRLYGAPAAGAGP
ncbi:serine hydrolase domain-containing protein [Pseudoxanthomonas sp. SGT-18]|uniref:serine hydrolase domain-containing protein n=1 Tax=Pseudoxanthomonas sp. SGT-18 TaxID=2493087 RepID=UPI000F62ADBC|nr:serine hydrolase domain-containing protein [Pseudoxanthomonas sp. SGT-18]